MNALKLACAVCAVLAMAGAVSGEEPMAPQPTAEHKALEAWVGSWHGEGDMKAGPFGPGGPMSWTEQCSWFEGSSFHVVCRSEGTGPAGPMKGLGIIGYNPGKGVYTHYGVDNTGWAGISEGSRDGDVWTFRSKEEMGGKTYHTRFSMTWLSASKMKFSWEMSEDGTDWMVLMDGTSTKK